MKLAKSPLMKLPSKLKPKLKPKTNYQSGLDAEEQAAKYLAQQGYNINETRYKTQYGEIDLIASNKNELIFVEVKKRKSFSADDPISQNQKERINNAALQYISENPDKNYQETRFDVIFIDSANQLSHIKDAWRI